MRYLIKPVFNKWIFCSSVRPFVILLLMEGTMCQVSTLSALTPAVPVLAGGVVLEKHQIPQPLVLSSALELRFGCSLLTQPGIYPFSLTLPGNQDKSLSCSLVNSYLFASSPHTNNCGCPLKLAVMLLEISSSQAVTH